MATEDADSARLKDATVASSDSGARLRSSLVCLPYSASFAPRLFCALWLVAVVLYDVDLQTLSPGAWLNDNIITFYCDIKTELLEVRMTGAALPACMLTPRVAHRRTTPCLS